MYSFQYIKKKQYIDYQQIRKMKISVPSQTIQRLMRMCGVAIGVYLNTVWMKKTSTPLDDIIWFMVIFGSLVLGLVSIVG